MKSLICTLVLHVVSSFGSFHPLSTHSSEEHHQTFTNKYSTYLRILGEKHHLSDEKNIHDFHIYFQEDEENGEEDSWVGALHVI